MRVPVCWLRDYVPIEMPLDELATRLSVATGRGRGDRAPRRRRTRTATSACSGSAASSRRSKHPNADRLQVTKVDVGEGEPRSIVCGAWNFGVGATVGVALPGAVLPNGARRSSGARFAARSRTG